MTTAPCLQISSGSIAAAQPRAWAIGCWRTLIFCSLFSVIFLPEFARDGTGYGSLQVYAKTAAGFRFIDLAILIMVFCHLVSLGCLRGKIVRFPRRLALPGLAFLVCIAVAVAYGNSRGGTNFFFDWRGLALGIGLYFVWSFWIQNLRDLDAAVRTFAVYMTVRIGLLYVLYLAGYHETLLGVSIPIFDGPALSCIVFAGLLAFRYRESAGTFKSRLLWSALAVAAYVIVLLCFRRTYWGELAVGTVILLLLRKRHRLRTFVVIVMALGLAGLILGSPFSGRIKSLDVTNADTEFSADNADHLLDLVDAWDQVRLAPVMGIGVGTSYPTWHIRNWKPDSVMVHNAPLHVWLKYGIAGLTCYLWFHIALLRWLYGRAKAPASQAFFSAAFAYVTAQFVMTFGFAPWPYSELQLTTLLSFILAAVVMASTRLPLRS